MPLFYDRLQEALQILSDFFMNEGRGLEGERLFSQTYRDMDLLLGLARLSSQQLIVEYYRLYHFLSLAADVKRGKVG